MGVNPASRPHWPLEVLQLRLRQGLHLRLRRLSRLVAMGMVRALHRKLLWCLRLQLWHLRLLLPLLQLLRRMR